MSFPRYPKYKASGVEWLGEVPAHWEVVPIRKAARLESGHTPSRNQPEYWENCTVPWFTLGDVWQIREGRADYIHETAEKVSEMGLANSSARLLPKGTVMLSRTASVGFSAIMGVAMATTQDFANWVCGESLHPEFLLQVLRSMGGEFERLRMGSTHNTIYMPDIQGLHFAKPPLEEQIAIARFVRDEAAKIDALVAEQQRLIELLKEKRQAVISHAVTKGLDPTAKMKPSGIEWLGDVPAHWEVSRIGHLFREVSEPGNDDLPVLSVSIHHGVSDDELGEEDLARKVTRSEDRTKYKRVSPSDLVYNMMRAWQGGFGTVAVEGMVSPAYLVARPRGDTPTWFVERQLRTPTAVQEMKRHSRGVTDFRLRLYWEEFKTMQVALPSPAEAFSIEGFIRSEEESGGALVAEAERAVALLQERRTALISAAVTGQIDVTQLANASA